MKRAVKFAGIRTCLKWGRYFVVRFIRRCLYRAFYLFEDCRIIQSMNGNIGQSTFYGYYNISPFNSKKDVLFQDTLHSLKDTSFKLELHLRLFRQEDQKVISLGKTNAWNWQQGCMLQWLGETDHKVIFNNYSAVEDKYFAEVLDTNSFTSSKLCLPIYSVSKDGSFALTLNFERLARLRPDYGYFSRKRQMDLDDEEDGIWRIDLATNRTLLIVSLQDLKNFQSDATMEDAEHKVNHIDISPSGLRFMFLHRWMKNGNRYMRLLTADCQGQNLHYITGNSMVSHNCWRNENEIISFCRLPDGRNRYVKFTDLTQKFEIIGENDFHRDGHPSVSPDGRWMLTDDYPDLSRFSGLYLYDLKEEKRYTIGKFFQPLKFSGQRRIDLHPRWSRDGRTISIDSGHSGVRTMYLLDVSKITCNGQEENSVC